MAYVVDEFSKFRSRRSSLRMVAGAVASAGTFGFLPFYFRMAHADIPGPLPSSVHVNNFGAIPLGVNDASSADVRNTNTLTIQHALIDLYAAGGGELTQISHRRPVLDGRSRVELGC